MPWDRQRLSGQRATMQLLIKVDNQFWCCWFIVYSCCSHCLWGVCVWSLFCYAVISVICISLAFILLRKRELVQLYYGWLLDVMWLLVFCVSSSCCSGLICSVWLWHFMVILTFLYNIQCTYSQVFVKFKDFFKNFLKRLSYSFQGLQVMIYIWDVTCDFQCGILTSVDSNEPVQLSFKIRNSKWCSVSR